MPEISIDLSNPETIPQGAYVHIQQTGLGGYITNYDGFFKNINSSFHRGKMKQKIFLYKDNPDNTTSFILDPAQDTATYYSDSDGNFAKPLQYGLDGKGITLRGWGGKTRTKKQKRRRTKRR
uniref:Uncharacterized protein n=1 Tax=viral metagenome TaxID=1070528 RepID=A0A6C0B615_9ZZZZ